MPNVTVPAADTGLPEEISASSRRGFLRSGAMAALAGAVAAPFAVATAETPAISPELKRLIEAHRIAFDNFYSLPDEAPDAELDALCEVSAHAADALCAYHCETIEEARVWASVIAAYIARSGREAPPLIALHALAGLPAEEAA